MNSTRFTVEIDGRAVLVDQTNQRVTILDDKGNVAFSEQIQVAAGSKGLFAILDSASPGKTA